MFHNREQAGYALAQVLNQRPLCDPLVLAIPRGGVLVGSVLAEELGAEFDVVLSRKLRAPGQPELAIGAVSESGALYMLPEADDLLVGYDDYLGRERQHQAAEVRALRETFRTFRRRTKVAGRTVIVVDDGMSTGSTMIAALHTVAAELPRELIAAVPVAPPERIADVRRHCDDVVCLLKPRLFWSVGQFYEKYPEVTSEEVVHVLQAQARRGAKVPG